MNDTAIERAKYQRVWAMPEYREACHGLRIWEERRDLFPDDFSTAVDIGCGLGRLFAHWNDAGIYAWGIDFASNCLAPEVQKTYGDRFYRSCLWEMNFPQQFEVGVCADVMEHIPEHRVAETLKAIGDMCVTVIFKIAHGPTNDLGGEPLHVTCKPRTWWIQQMEAIGGEVTDGGIMVRHNIKDSLLVWRPE